LANCKTILAHRDSPTIGTKAPTSPRKGGGSGKGESQSSEKPGDRFLEKLPQDPGVSPTTRRRKRDIQRGIVEKKKTVKTNGALAEKMTRDLAKKKTFKSWGNAADGQRGGNPQAKKRNGAGGAQSSGDTRWQS